MGRAGRLRKHPSAKRSMGVLTGSGAVTRTSQERLSTKAVAKLRSSLQPPQAALLRIGQTAQLLWVESKMKYSSCSAQFSSW